MLALGTYDLWLSRDGGASWRSSTAHLPYSGPLSDLEVDPFDHSHWILIARGSFTAPWSLLAETRDQGGSWSLRPLPTTQFNAILFDTATPGLLLAGGPNGLYRSRDGGGSWAEMELALPTLFQLQAAHQGRFYVSYGSQLPGLRRPHRHLGAARGGTAIFPRAAGRPDPAEYAFARTSGKSSALPTAAAPSRWCSSRAPTSSSASTSRRTTPATWRPSRRPASTCRSTGAKRGARSRSSSTTTPARRAPSIPAPASCFSTKTRRSPGAVRRHPVAVRPRGLYAMTLVDVLLDLPRNRLFALSLEGAIFRRDGDLRWRPAGRADCGVPQTIVVAPWNPDQLYVTCFYSYLTSLDGGLSFAATPIGGADACVAQPDPFRPRRGKPICRQPLPHLAVAGRTGAADQRCGDRRGDRPRPGARHPGGARRGVSGRPDPPGGPTAASNCCTPSPARTPTGPWPAIRPIRQHLFSLGNSGNAASPSTAAPPGRSAARFCCRLRSPGSPGR